MTPELQRRIIKIYAAIAETQESDLSKIPVTPLDTGGFGQDFHGGLTDAQISNRADSAIDRLACLKDHLCKWAKQNKKCQQDVDRAVENSEALKIIIDLWNLEKHGPRRGGNPGDSGRHPRLEGVDRGLRVNSQPGEACEFTFGPQGMQVAGGSPDLRVVIDGRVVDGKGNQLGNLQDILDAGLKAWEELLQQWA